MQKIFFILLGLFGLSNLLKTFSWKKIHFSKTYLADIVALKSEFFDSIFHCTIVCSRTTDCTFGVIKQIERVLYLILLFHQLIELQFYCYY